MKIAFGGVFATLNAAARQAAVPGGGLRLPRRRRAAHPRPAGAPRRSRSGRRASPGRRRTARCATTPTAPLDRDLDQWPFPDRESLPLDFVESMPLDVPAVLSLDRFTTMQTSRGCPWPCVFCDIPIFNEGKWRSRSPEHVVAEFEAAPEGRLRRRLLRGRPLPAPAEAHRGDLPGDHRRTASPSSGAARDASTRVCMQLFPAMAKAHCRTLMFGIESGSQKILDRLKKEQTLAGDETAVNERQAGGHRDRPRLLRRRQPRRDRRGHAADLPLRLQAAASTASASTGSASTAARRSGRST